jgi:glycosyltransferase involved in cell wall biosynthesis
MNIAFVYAMPTEEAALARRMRRTSELLAARGHDVRTFCLSWWENENRGTTHRNVPYRAVSDSERWFPTKLPGVLADYRPDIVHVAGTDPKAALAAQLSGRPIVLDWCGEESSQLLDRAFSSADRVIVPSEHVRTKVRERGADATVVSNGIRLDAIREIEPSGSAALLWAGSLDAHANLGGLLLALAEFRHREWRTTVIGNGPCREEYERLAADLRISDRVDFGGKLPRDECIARMKGAHVFVQTADRTPFGIELLYALACGCVGIVEYQPDSAAHELIAGYNRGIGVTSEEEIAGAIERAGEYPQKTDDACFERFAHENVVERYLALYRECGAVVQ